MNLIDKFLNNITMYRLVLYYLIGLILMGMVFSLFNLLPFNPVALLFSTGFLIAVAWLTNTIFARTFKAPTNLESVYITALILALLITPPRILNDFIFLFWAAVLAVSSKYIIALKNKHLFNPAALALVITSSTLNLAASWWVGTMWMVPFVLIGGILVVRKIRRFDLVWSFFFAFFSVMMASTMIRNGDLIFTFKKALVDSPAFFFVFVMLTEPLTTPPTKTLQAFYGGIVGFLFSPQVHFGSLYTTPELALVMGNIFSYLVSPKEKLILHLKNIVKVAPDVYDFVFSSNQKILFNPGQYLEWTLGYKHPDSRGNRRYFTISSSPSEWDLSIGVKFYPKASGFKKGLASLKVGDTIVASGLSGEFILPKDKNKKLVFIAGGIGVTPFRSMVKFLLDTKEKRDVVLLYSNKIQEEIAYKNIFDQATREIGLRVDYVLTEATSGPENWPGHIGYIDEKLIAADVPDYRERYFYISGPHSMVTAFQHELNKLGIPKKQIKTDFFPGFA